MKHLFSINLLQRMARRNSKDNKQNNWINIRTFEVGLQVPNSGDENIISVSAKIKADIVSLKQKAAILTVRLFDEQGDQIGERDVRGLSWSRNAGLYKYVDVCSSPTGFKVQFVSPKEARKIVFAFMPWSEKKKKILLNDFVITAELANSDDFNSMRYDSSTEPINIIGWPPPNQIDEKPTILGIMDEFTSTCFAPEANLVLPRPDNWRELFDRSAPDLIFIESAWRGNQGSWQYRVARYSYSPGSELKQLCKYARRKGVPVIFWNKEDPVHYEKFIDSCKISDAIFTTDARRVDQYKKDTNIALVNPLPFAAQPKIHYPRPLHARMRRACFAGSWYGNRHQERGDAMSWLLPAVAPLGLDIFDRNHGTGVFPFPQELEQCVVGSLPYEALCQAYSQYRVFLNVNSVINSPTMFSRRVFELLASGTPVVSTESDAIENILGTDSVIFVRNAAEAQEAVSKLLSDDDFWRQRSIAGMRAIYSGHTYADRLTEIFRTLECDRFSKQSGQVSAIFTGDKDEYNSFILGNECERDPIDKILLLDKHRNFLTDETGNMISKGEDGVLAKELLRYLNVNHIKSAIIINGDSAARANTLRDLIAASVYAPDADFYGFAPDTKQEYAYNAELSPHTILFDPNKIGQAQLMSAIRGFLIGRTYAAQVATQ